MGSIVAGEGIVSDDTKCVKCGHTADTHNEYNECLTEGCECSLNAE